MLFKLINVPAAFMNLMNQVFQSHSFKFVIVFIDDILICYKTNSKRAQQLKFVLQTIY